jgi:hypothetical protein
LGIDPKRSITKWILFAGPAEGAGVREAGEVEDGAGAQQTGHYFCSTIKSAKKESHKITTVVNENFK